MRAFLIVKLRLPNFGQMTNFAMQLESRDKTLLMMSQTKIIMS